MQKRNLFSPDLGHSLPLAQSTITHTQSSQNDNKHPQSISFQVDFFFHLFPFRELLHLPKLKMRFFEIFDKFGREVPAGRDDQSPMWHVFLSSNQIKILAVRKGLFLFCLLYAATYTKGAGLRGKRQAA